jgi:molybdopterin converting factor subunit 1
MSAATITIKFFATLKEKIGENERTITLAQGSAVDNVLEDLKKQYPEFAKLIDCSLVALNEEYALPGCVLQDGDILAIIPPVSGG